MKQYLFATLCGVLLVFHIWLTFFMYDPLPESKLPLRKYVPLFDDLRPPNREDIVLLTSHYKEKDPARRKEMEASILENVANPFFTGIRLLVNLVDDKSILDFLYEPAELMLQKINQVWPDYAEHSRTIEMLNTCLDRVRVSFVPHHPENDKFNTSSPAYLYSEFFQYANAYLNGATVVLSNADIVFPPSSVEILKNTGQKLLKENKKRIYTLSRYNRPCADAPDCEGRLYCRESLCDGFGASADTFVFIPPMSEIVVMEAKHPQNQIAAENLLFKILREEGGYVISNPCKEVLIYHNHCVRDHEAFIGGKELIDIFVPPCFDTRICMVPFSEINIFK